MARALVIAIGNQLRSDDGIAWRVAEELKHDAGLEIITVHQLTPELADSASQADLVVFVDAAAIGVPGTVGSMEVSAEDTPLSFSHALTPQSLLGIAQTLYAKQPKAFLVSVSGSSFGHGESLSPEVQASIPALLVHIRKLIRTVSAKDAPSR